MIMMMTVTVIRLLVCPDGGLSEFGGVVVFMFNGWWWCANPTQAPP